MIFFDLGSVLAHAFYPEEHLGGDVHYDEDEDWTAYRENEYGLSLFSSSFTSSHRLSFLFCCL